MTDMQTMPVPELVKEIRIRTENMEPLQALVLNCLANRLDQQEERLKAALRQEQRATTDLRREVNSHKRTKKLLRKCKEQRR